MASLRISVLMWQFHNFILLLMQILQSIEKFFAFFASTKWICLLLPHRQGLKIVSSLCGGGGGGAGSATFGMLWCCRYVLQSYGYIKAV